MRWAGIASVTVSAALGALLGAPDARAASAGPDGVSDLSGLWLFHDGDDPSFAHPDLDDYQWRQLHVPTGPSDFSSRWQGLGWYRVHVHLTDVAAEEPLLLALGPAREVVEVYVNGVWTASRGNFGSRLGGAQRVVPFVVPVAPSLVHRGDNVIALRTYDPSFNGGFPAGPLLLGPPQAVRSAHGISWGRMVRLSFGFLALFIAVAQLILQFGSRGGQQALWLSGAGVALAFLLFDGTGTFAALLPVDLSARMALVLTPIAVLCVGSYFASRYEDYGTAVVTYGRYVLLALAALFLFLPNAWVFPAAPPILVILAMATSLYCVNLCVQAVRRGDPDSVPILVGVCAVTVLLIYDGWSSGASEAWPAASVLGSVGLLTAAAGLNANGALRENRESMRRLAQLRSSEGDAHRGLLDAAAMTVLEPEQYLKSAVHELARDLAVRRCSLALKDADGVLRVTAAVGLPNHLKTVVIDKESIAAHVFDTGETLRSGELPPHLAHKTRGSYTTSIFRATPVRSDGRIIGVLNISDRNDGGDFENTDEAAIAAGSEKLGIVLSQISGAARNASPAKIASSRAVTRDVSVSRPVARDVGVSRPVTRSSPLAEIDAEVKRIIQGSVGAPNIEPPVEPAGEPFDEAGGGDDQDDGRDEGDGA